MRGSRCDPHEEQDDLPQAKPPLFASYKLDVLTGLQAETGTFASYTVF